MTRTYPATRIQWRQILTFVGTLLIVLTLSVAVFPPLPAIFSPQLVPLAMTIAALEDQLLALNGWAIWGGLLGDLLMPGTFGLLWVPTLVAALVLHGARRVGMPVEPPWLWPVWFLVSTLVSLSLLALVTGEWTLWLTEGWVTALWGTVGLGLVRWSASSRREVT